jgi:aspartyl-tRNA(Asn)/glutamyl-tRNA(Gln) amidotransferase subunit A
MEPLHRLSISELAAGFSSGGVRVSVLGEHMLARISALDPSLRAFIQVDEAGSREAAADSESRFAAGRARPLEGVPIAVKANIGVEGLEISAGMEARRGLVATEDADAVARLRESGAIVLGTLNMHEAALGADNDNPWFGRAINPHGNERYSRRLFRWQCCRGGGWSLRRFARHRHARLHSDPGRLIAASMA